MSCTALSEKAFDGTCRAYRPASIAMGAGTFAIEHCLLERAIAPASVKVQNASAMLPAGIDATVAINAGIRIEFLGIILGMRRFG